MTIPHKCRIQAPFPMSLSFRQSSSQVKTKVFIVTPPTTDDDDDRPSCGACAPSALAAANLRIDPLNYQHSNQKLDRSVGQTLGLLPRRSWCYLVVELEVLVDCGRSGGRSEYDRSVDWKMNKKGWKNDKMQNRKKCHMSSQLTLLQTGELRPNPYSRCLPVKPSI